MRAFLIAAIAALTMTGPALACTADEIDLADAQKLGRDAVASDASVVFTEFTDNEALRLVDAINGTAPPTNFSADRVLVIDDHDEPYYRVALAHGACVFAAMRISRQAFDADVEKARGVQS